VEIAKMTLYKTQIMFFHNEPLTEMDKSVLMGKVNQHAGLNEILIYWIICRQAQVTEQELKEAAGGGCL